jgi:serine/threonine protein phosphatase PrpC
MRHFGQTHIGNRKPENQDRIAFNEALSRFVVADGMSGLADGALASRVVCDAIAGVNAPRSLESAVAAAQDTIMTLSRRAKRMGATAIAAEFGQDTCRLAWLGDCRGYLWRDRAVTRLTADHSVEAMLRGSSARPASARDADTVTRYFGSEDAEASYVTVKLRAQDWVLLCTDGIWRVVSDAQIGDLLADAESLQDAVFALVASALGAGAPDNLGVYLVDPGPAPAAVS